MEDENKVVEMKTENNEAANAATEIVVADNGGKAKKILKWVVGGLAIAASFVSGMLLGGRNKNDDDDDSDSAENESPTED